jgi:hypothetical protein
VTHMLQCQNDTCEMKLPLLYGYSCICLCMYVCLCLYVMYNGMYMYIYICRYELIVARVGAMSMY